MGLFDFFKKKEKSVETNSEDSQKTEVVQKDINLYDLFENHEDPEIIKELEKMNELNEIKKNGNSLLHLAVGNERIEASRFLIDNGIDVNMQNNAMQTPLHIAITTKNDDLIELMVLNGTTWDIKDDSGLTAWDYSATFGKRALLEKYIKIVYQRISDNIDKAFDK